MAELNFACLDGQALRFAAVPTLQLTLQIEETTGDVIQGIALRCQLRIEAQRRRYSAAEADRLTELFGETSRWGDTLKPLHFANVSLMVPAFVGTTEIDLPVPCTYDFEVAATKYLHALDDGEIPLLLLFSGTVFSKRETGFSVAQVPWSNEARYALPARRWREVMDLYFPNSGWIRMRRDTLDALQQFKVRQAMTSWDEALTALLKSAEQEV